jgi:molecular chaperone IbpA
MSNSTIPSVNNSKTLDKSTLIPSRKPEQSLNKLFDQLATHIIGMDTRLNPYLFEQKTTHTSFPPYNIVKLNDNTYTIEVALAGYSTEDIAIEKTENKLTIFSTNKQVSDDTDSENIVEPAKRIMLHHGIASRQFNIPFTLDENMEIQHASMKNGMLSILLERRIPEEKLPKRIPISPN